jgi:hypothetical protein
LYDYPAYYPAFSQACSYLCVRYTGVCGRFCSFLLSFNTCVICTRNCGSWFLYLLSAVCYLSFWVTGSMSMSMGSKGQGHLSSFIFSIHVLLSRFTAMDCTAEGSRRTESRYLRRIRFSSRMVSVNTFMVIRQVASLCIFYVMNLMQFWRAIVALDVNVGRRECFKPCDLIGWIDCDSVAPLQRKIARMSDGINESLPHSMLTCMYSIFSEFVQTLTSSSTWSLHAFAQRWKPPCSISPSRPKVV